MGAVAECDVPVRLAIGAERERILEDILVAVAGRIAQHQPVAFGDLASAQFGVGGRRSHEGLHRGHPANGLVDQTWNQLRIGLDLGKLLRIFGERPDRARRRRRGGIVAGGGHDHVVARDIEGRQIRAVDLAVGDHGSKVILWIGAPVLGDFAEISPEIIDDRHDHFGKLFGAELFPDPRGVGILRSEQFLGELEHPRFVLFRHTENFHDDMQRISERDVGDEIASARHAPPCARPRRARWCGPFPRIFRD